MRRVVTQSLVRALNVNSTLPGRRPNDAVRTDFQFYLKPLQLYSILRRTDYIDRLLFSIAY